MPRVHWLDVPHATSYRMIVGTIPLDEKNASALYSPLLKSNLNLVARTCSKLRLTGRYALQGARSPRLEVRIAFEKSEDAAAFGRIVGLSSPLLATPCTFTFDEQTNAELGKSAEPTRHRDVGRRAKERAARHKAAMEWTSRAFHRHTS